MTAQKATTYCKGTYGPAGPGAEDDALLLNRAREGNCDAFQCLVEPYVGKLFKSILSITRNREDAEDSLQETLLKAFIHLEQFKGTSSFGTWLVSIGVNQALMCLRKRRRIVSSLDTNEHSSDAWASPDLPESRPNPEQQYRNTEWAEILRKAVNTLPSTFREVFELRYVAELTNEQVAMALGISIAAVKTRALRARRHIGRRLSGRWKKECGSINGYLSASMAVI